MAPLTAEELARHPEYEHTIWKLKPDQEGKVAVANDRGGPINIAYEVHGHGDRKIVVSAHCSSDRQGTKRQVSISALLSYSLRKRLAVTFRFGRIDRLSLRPHVSSCRVYFATHI